MSSSNCLHNILASDHPKLVFDKNGRKLAASELLYSFTGVPSRYIKNLLDITEFQSDFFSEGKRSVILKRNKTPVEIIVTVIDEETFCAEFLSNTSITPSEAGQHFMLMHTIYKSIYCGVVVFTLEKRIKVINANDNAMRILGFPDKATYLSLTSSDIYMPIYLPDIPYSQSKIEQCSQTDDIVPFKNRVVRCDGTIAWIEGSLKRISTSDGGMFIQCSFIDITEQLKAEEKLKMSEERLLAVSEFAHVNLWEYYPDNDTIVMFNGNNKYNAASRSCIAKESLPEYNRIHEEIKNGAPTATGMLKGNTETAPAPWYKMSYKSCFDENGKVIRAIGTSVDITDTKYSRERYIASKELMRRISNSVLACCCVNLTENLVDNFAADQRFGIEGSDGMKYDTLCERIFAKVEDKTEYESAMETMRRTTLLERFRNSVNHAKIICRRRIDEGCFIWIEITMSLMREPETGNIIGFAYARECGSPIEEATRSERLLLQFKRAAGSAYYFVLSIDYNAMTYDLIHLSEMSKKKTIPFSGSISVYIEYARKHFGEGFSEMADTLADYESLITAMNGLNEITIEVYSDSGSGLHWFEHKVIRASENPDDKLFLCLTSIIDHRKHREETLRRALERADAAQKVKRDFISHMSREIRTPLYGITGMLDIMKQRSALADDDCLKNAVMSANHLTCLMNDILDMTALENGRVTLEDGLLSRGEFDGFIRSVIQPLADKKRILFTINYQTDDCPDFICDIGRLLQIIINLLTNAVKFTQENGSVVLSAYAHNKHGEYADIDFTVTDTGEGMSEEFLSHAFEPFDREDNTENSSGTGLGLAIVKRLVELMNGEIRIESTQGSGTTVYVKLTLRIAGENDIRRRRSFVHKPSVEFPDLAGKHALVVEDNNLNMEIAEHQLRSLHLIVDKATNGLEAIQAFENSYNGYYDIIFMDVVMPKCDGYAATRAIRLMDREDAKVIPIVAMTANVFPEDAHKTYENGMNYLLAKPFSAKDIKEILQREFTK